jgi:hypothetical protein
MVTMAIMIPDSCPSKATVGEKRTFGLLRDGLPDQFTAWYEPVVVGRYTGFCLIADDFGLLMPDDEARHLRPPPRRARPGMHPPERRSEESLPDRWKVRDTATCEPLEPRGS